jgi:hypothetical protein
MNIEAIWKVARRTLEAIDHYGTPLYQREVAITTLCSQPFIVVFEKLDGEPLRFLTQFELDVEGHATELDRTVLRNALQIRSCLVSPPAGIGWPFNAPGYREAPLEPRMAGKLMAQAAPTGTVTTAMAEASANPVRRTVTPLPLNDATAPFIQASVMTVRPADKTVHMQGVSGGPLAPRGGLITGGKGKQPAPFAASGKTPVPPLASPPAAPGKGKGGGTPQNASGTPFQPLAGKGKGSPPAPPACNEPPRRSSASPSGRPAAPPLELRGLLLLSREGQG